MKKVVRMLGLCALVALAFSSCNKKETESASFTATISQPTTNVRTHVAGTNAYYLVWSQNDAIKVFDAAFNTRDFTLYSGEDDMTATFRAVGQDKVGFLSHLTSETYTAFYPKAQMDENDNVNLVIPANQVYEPAHSFKSELYPMVGFNVDPETGDNVDNFVFDSKAGFLYLLFQAKAPGVTVSFDKVVVTTDADNDYVAGTYVYDKDGTYIDFIGSSTVSTITSPEKIVVSWPALMDVTFVLPEGALASGFTVDVYDGDELIWTRHAPAEVNAISARKFREMPSMKLGQDQPTPPEP